jgi:hypothetical protein
MASQVTGSIDESVVEIVTGAVIRGAASYSAFNAAERFPLIQGRRPDRERIQHTEAFTILTSHFERHSFA